MSRGAKGRRDRDFLNVLDEFSSDAIAILGSDFEKTGFKLTKVGLRMLEFSSPSVTVQLFQGRKSSTIGVVIARGDSVIGLDALLEYAAAQGPGMTARTRDAVRSRLSWLGSFIFTRFGKLLGGGESDFAEVAKLARSRDERYSFKLLVLPEIERANECFRDKQYHEVVEILEPIENQLGSVAKAKLTFAKRHLKGRQV
jgi:hypothetical protein